MEEIRKDVVGYEGLYLVSDRGRIMSLKRSRVPNNRILRNQYDGHGYYYVTFVTDGKRINHKIHKLVAMAFIKNKDNKKTVNHIDGNKANNNLWNLEWMTQSENNIHAKEIGLNKGLIGKRNKLIKQYSLDGEYIQTFEDADIAANLVGGLKKTILACCRGEYYSYKGYIWKYHNR